MKDLSKDLTVLLVGPLAPKKTPSWLTPLMKQALLIAVDGGVGWLRARGRVPHFLVGDLDSAQKKDVDWAFQKGTQIFALHPDKDQSDFAFALGFAQSLNPKQILCIGFLGGRMDHEHAVLLESAKTPKQWVMHLPSEVHRGSYFLSFIPAGKQAQIKVKRKELFSLFATNGQVRGLHIRGSKYDVRNVKLNTSSFGLSNEGRAGLVTIRHKKGTLLLMSRDVPKVGLR